MNVSPLRFNKLVSLVPTDYHVIRFLIDNPIEPKRVGTPVESCISEFVRKKIEARESHNGAKCGTRDTRRDGVQDATEEYSLQQSVKNMPRLASGPR